MKKTKKFFVMAKIEIQVQKLISADSLTDAVEKSKGMNVDDFIEIPTGNLIDSEMKVTGAFENE